jgi:hypothetical protein
MTVSEATPIDRYTGDGSTVAFSFSYNVFDLADVVVELYSDASPAVLQSATRNGSGIYDYTVTGSLSATTNRYTSVTVTFNTAPPTDYLIGLYRRQDREQDTSLTNGGAFDEKSVEFQLDKLTHMIQDLQELVDRAPLTSAATQKHVADIVFNASARVTGLPDPVSNADAVNLGYLAAQTLALTTGTIATVNTYALMTALDTSETTFVICTGRTGTNDGGGGLFVWDSTSTETDNGGTIFESDAGGTGRWHRIWDTETLKATWFGVTADGTTQDHPELKHHPRRWADAAGRWHGRHGALLEHDKHHRHSGQWRLVGHP